MVKICPLGIELLDVDGETDRQADRQAGRQTGRQADRQTDRETDMTKLIIPFRNFASAPEK